MELQFRGVSHAGGESTVLQRSPGAASDEGSEADAPDEIRFRQFRVLPGARLLISNGRSIRLGGRAFDLLLVLLRARGRLLPQQEIMSQVWPSTVVEESNLRFQIASLRRALGANDRDVIKTVSGRGYLFIADVEEIPAPSSTWIRTAPAGTLPALDGRLSAPRLDASADNPTEVDKPTVVIIDDDNGVREALACLLVSIGLCVETYDSVIAYLRSDRSTAPACLVLDVWMPGCNGLEFQADLAKSGVYPPVIFISGHADVPTSVQAMKAGAFEFLIKPVRHQDLLNAVRAAIASGGPADRRVRTIQTIHD